MKRIIIFSIVLFVFAAFTTEAKRHRNMSGYFYTELAPYGQWIEIDYGVVVWQPTIMQTGWAPYSMGRWIWTYDGWYWDSYESFGYVTYHYGRWFYDDYYGWLWYPDYQWAPAWVEWRYSNNYIGWAPLHPYATFSVSIGIHFTNAYYTPYNYWNFVAYNNFCNPYPYNYYVAPNYRYRVYSNTTYRTNYRYRNGRVQNRGIDIDYVRVRSGQEIRQREITRVRDPRQMRGNYGKRDEIRTLDVSRDQLVRNDVRNMNVKKDRRRTSLDVNRVELGNRNRTTTVTRNDVKNQRKIDKKRNVNRQKTVTRNDVKRNRTDKKTVDRQRTQKEVKRNQVIKNKNRNNNNNVNRNKVDKKTRTKRNDVNKNKTVRKKNVNRNNQQQVNTNKNNRNDRNIVKQNKTVKKNNVNRNQNKVNTNNNRKDVVKKNNNKKNIDRKVNRNNNNNRKTTTRNKKKNDEKVKREKKQQKTTNNNNTNRKRTR